MAIAGSLVVTVSAKTTDFENGMKRARTEMRTTQQATVQMQSAFGGLTSSLVGLTAGVASVGALTASIKDLVRVGTEMQTLRNSFTAITGSTQAGNREFQFAIQTANNLGVEVKSLAESYRGLMASTRGTALEGAGTRDLFTQLTKAAQTYGLSTEQLGRALVAFQQILSKGKVAQEELRGQLAEALPGALQIAARAYGTNTKALEDMIAKGVDAVDFTTRFVAQLKTETPLASTQAAKGFAQLGNEILLLKDRIAQSGLIQFLDDVSSRLAKILGAMRAERAGPRSDVLTMLGPAAGVVKPDELERMITMQQQGNDVSRAALQEQIDLMRQRWREQQRFADREKQIQNQDLDNKAILRDQAAANKTIQTTLQDNKKATDDLNKSSAQTPEIYGKINGTLEQQITFLQKRKAITEKSLEDLTKAITERTERTGAVPADLAKQKADLQAQYAADVAGIASRQQAIQDAAAAERKAIQDREAAQRKAQQLAEETRRLDLQQAEEVARVHFQNIEALRTLASKYTEVKATRDADTASFLAASLATSQYAKEAQALAAALADVQRIEEQLPTLRSQAKTSAANLERYQQAIEDMQPQTRGLTRREELERRYQEFSKTTSDQEQLRRVRTEMETTLYTERMQELYGHLQKMGEELANTFVDMAVTGEFSFKKLADSFSRMVLDMVADAIDLKGAISGWLKQALGQPGGGGQAGSGLLGAIGGLFGGGGAANPALQADISKSMAANPSLFAFGGGMAAGGPVMPGRFYTVGERGPETLIAGAPGTVVPHGAGGAINVTYNIHTPDVGGFRSSQRQLMAETMRQAQQARRIM